MAGEDLKKTKLKIMTRIFWQCPPMEQTIPRKLKWKIWNNFGMFGFPLVFCRFIGKRYSVQKYDTPCQQFPILSERMRALIVHAALLPLPAPLTISPKPTCSPMSMLLKRKKEKQLAFVHWGGGHDIFFHTIWLKGWKLKLRGGGG